MAFDLAWFSSLSAECLCIFDLLGAIYIMVIMLSVVSVDDLEKTEDPLIHSSRSADPRIQSDPSLDPPVNSSRSVVSTGRVSSAAKNEVMNYLEKVDVESRLGDIDQVYSCRPDLISDTDVTLSCDFLRVPMSPGKYNTIHTIRYDSVYLTCSKKLTGSQLSPPHGINKQLKCKTKNKMMSVIGPVKSRYREAVQ